MAESISGISQDDVTAEEWAEIVTALRRVRDASKVEQDTVYQQTLEALPAKLRRRFESEYRATLGESFEGEYDEAEPQDPVATETIGEQSVVDDYRQVREKREAARKEYTERFGNEGKKVSGTSRSAWYDFATDSMYVIGSEGEKFEVRKNGIHNFGTPKQPLYKKWLGNNDGGWVDFSKDTTSQNQQVNIPQPTTDTIASQQVALQDRPIEQMTSEERQAEIRRLRQEAASQGINVDDIPSTRPRPVSQPQTADTLHFNREIHGQRYAVNSKGEAVVHREPDEHGEEPASYVIRDGGIHRWEDDEGTKYAMKWNSQDKKWTAIETASGKSPEPHTISKEKEKEPEAPKKKNEPGIAKMLEDMEKKTEQGLAAFRKEIGELLKGKSNDAAKTEKPTDERELAKWEFTASSLSERIEKGKAALRARKEVGLSEARERNNAEIFFGLAEKWKKFPLWAKLGTTFSILGAGVAGSVFSPAIAAFAGLSALAWRGIAAVGAGAVMGTAAVTYLKKRNSRHPWLWGALAGVGVGATAFGSKYIAEYITGLMPASEGAVSGAAAIEVPKGTPEIHWSGTTDTIVGSSAFNGTDLDSAIDTQILTAEGPLKDFNLSSEAQAELRKGMKLAVVQDNPKFAEAFMGRVPAIVPDGTSIDTVLKPGDTLHWGAFGDPAHAAKVKDYLTYHGSGHLVPELNSKGGIDGFLARLQEVFAKK